jgi:hypothetical protein
MPGATINQEAIIANPIIKKMTTPPPKVVALGFHVAGSNAQDSEVIGFDTIVLNFSYSEQDRAERSSASQFMISISDLDTGVVKSYFIKAFVFPYYYWQRAQELKASNFSDENIDDAIVNARVTITPINDEGKGNRSTFLMPMKNLYNIGIYDMEKNPTTLILAKYWNLFSLTPGDIYNRPKVMHIYLNVSQDDIIRDKNMLNQEEYRYNTIGTYLETNQEMFRWVIQDEDQGTSYTRLNQNDIFVDMTQKEIKYIKLILNSFNDIYRERVLAVGAQGSDPVVFKVSTENPRDHNDSIIIYVMKGTRWEI